MTSCTKKSETGNTAVTASVSCTQTEHEALMNRAVETAIAVVTSYLNRLWSDKIKELENRLLEMYEQNKILDTILHEVLVQQNENNVRQTSWEKAMQKTKVHTNDIEQHNRIANIPIYGLSLLRGSD